MLKPTFWILLSIILYAYFGYALLLLFLNGLKLLFTKTATINITEDLPEATLLIAAYNEKDIVEAKMQNTRNLDYPSQLLKVLWITDGSDDGTPNLLKQNYPEIEVLHIPERKGKTAALNRAIKQIKTPFVIFSDANTMLDPSAIKNLLYPFNDKKIGCVAGEKRIAKSRHEGAAGAGEGTYWQYESWVKNLESNFYSALAAAGELYAIRTDLYSEVNPDSIIDDFVISLHIAQRGYQIKYEPKAYALEAPSASIREELKRKIRIASGGIQTLLRFPGLLNFFKHGFLSFEFFSHKVLRWLFVPLAIPLLLLVNILICHTENWETTYFLYLLILQGVFYFLVAFGFLFENRSTRMKFLFLPYYLIIMNYSQIAGLLRYILRKHTVVWEKAKRA